MPVNFTKTDLKKQSGIAVFNRGVNYYQDGAVDEIKRVIDKYVAKVYGSVVYKVEYTPDENTFSCNCPYDGFCKHLVAFGLQLLSEKKRLPATENFDTWFNSINSEIKQRLLREVVRKDISLREKLDRMNRQDDHPLDINDIADAVYSSMDALTYDDVWENRSGYDYYVDEFEVADDLIAGELDDYFSEVEYRIQAGKTEQAFEYILGIYLGLQRSNDTEIAEYFDELESFLGQTLAHFLTVFKEQSDAIKLKILRRFIAFCKNNPVDDLYFFNEFLLLFATGEYSDMLKKFLLNYSGDYTVKGILMRIAESQQDIVLMKKILKNSTDAALHIPYLNFLKASGEYEKIKQIMLKFADERGFCELGQFVIPELGVETCKNLLLNLIENCFKLKYYKKYKKLLTEDEKRKFLSGIQDNITESDERYALPVLFYEKIYDPVLKVIENSTNNDYGFESYRKYLKEIAKTMPGRVWDIYSKHVDFLLEQRNRTAYSEMTHYLNIMKKIDKGKTGQSISAYYNHTPRLPALKDEFNKAGLV